MGLHVSRCILRYGTLGILLGTLVHTTWASVPQGDPRGELDLRFGIQVEDHRAPFSDRQLEQILGELSTGALKTFPRIETLTTLSKKPHWGTAFAYYGRYDPLKKRIEIIDGGPHIVITFIHELFHSLAAQYPAAYEDFLKQIGWKISSSEDDIQYSFRGTNFTDSELRQNPDQIVALLRFDDFPSDYSKMGPAEMFAEAGAATTLILDKNAVDKETEADPAWLPALEPEVLREGKALYHLQDFEQSKTYRWMSRFIETGGQL